MPSEALSSLIAKLREGIEVKVESIESDGKSLLLGILIINRLPMEISIDDLNLSLYTLDGVHISNLNILEGLPVRIKPGSEALILVGLELDSRSFSLIYESIMAGVNRFNVKGLVVFSFNGLTLELDIDFEVNIEPRVIGL